MLDRGFVQVYTGDGKGKTTAALGLVLRAVGAGLRIYIAQFAKGSICSEHAALERLGNQITLRQFGRVRFVAGAPGPEDIAMARHGLESAREAMVCGRFDVVVFDEVLTAVHLGLLRCEGVVEVVNERPANVEMVMTGRRAPRELIDMADLVTEMREVKHYFAHGVTARAGIEM